VSELKSPEVALIESGSSPADEPGETPPPAVPRVWPAVLIVLLQACFMVLTITPSINNFSRFIAMMVGPAACLLLFMAWLLLLSRLQWRHRFLILSGMFLVLLLTAPLLHRSMYVVLWLYGMPLTMAVITLTLWLASRWNSTPRTITTLLAVLLAASPFQAARMEGFDGSYHPQFRWRWSQPADVRILAKKPGTSKTVAAATSLPPLTASDWPGFRGPHRDSRVTTAVLPTGWDKSPLEEMWRIPVGPAWSSFAGAGERLYTQEQRGGNELVVCYHADTGKEIWRRADLSKFNEVVSGSGPRATPTLAKGRVYTLGGKAILNCLDAATGKLIWQKDLGKDKEPAPIWGYSASPLVFENSVMVYLGGPQSGQMLAFATADGKPLWSVDSPGMNYSSPHLATLAGKTCVLLAGTKKIMAIEPASGGIAWQYNHNGKSSMAVVQPHVIDGKSVIVPFGDGDGVARIDVELAGGKWKVKHVWDSKSLKPSFNDFVYFQDHLYGFDQEIFTCISLQNGRRKWKGGRYGFGQVMLFPDQSLLLVAAENGSLVLLKADPAKHQQLASMQAVEGKTWNHPMVLGNRLVVRNGVEAVCYKLPAPATD